MTTPGRQAVIDVFGDECPVCGHSVERQHSWDETCTRCDMACGTKPWAPSAVTRFIEFRRRLRDPLTCALIELVDDGRWDDCDCDPAAFHRWNCHTTSIWAQVIRDLDVNPWTVMDAAINRWRSGRLYAIGGVIQVPRGRCAHTLLCQLTDGHDGKCRP